MSGSGSTSRLGAPTAAPEARPPVSPLAIETGQRLPLLDGVRGLAIALVLVNNLYPERAAGSTLDTLAVHLTDFWWVGVDLFFVLSGFLITGILYDTRTGAHYFRNFYARRVLRIVPLYYAVLALIYFVVPHTGFATSEQLRRLHEQRWYFWAYLANLGYALHGSTGFRTDHFWSLAVEEQFYLVWPVLVWLVERRQLIALCATAMVAGFVLRLTWLLAGMSSTWVYMLTPFRLDGLAVGAAIALLLRAPGGVERLARWAPSVWRVCAPLALVLVAAYEIPRSERWGVVLQVVGYPAIALAFGALLVFALTARPRSRMSRLLGGAGMRALGRYSYGIYVLHPLVLLFFTQRYGWAASPPALWGTRIPAGLALFALTSVISITLGVASWHLYEQRFLALKRYFPYARGEARGGGSSER